MGTLDIREVVYQVILDIVVTLATVEVGYQDTVGTLDIVAVEYLDTVATQV